MEIGGKYNFDYFLIRHDTDINRTEFILFRFYSVYC